MTVKILVVDNYDSFVYTLVGYLEQLGAKTTVIRNDDLDETAACALATIALLLRRRFAVARFVAAAQVGLVVLGWGVAMDGHFLLPDLSAAAAVTQPAVLPALALVLAVALAILAPSL